MRVNVENIVSEMETFDLVAEDDSVLEKLLEHCITYRLKEEGIVHEWFAFSATRGGIALNADNVEIFEHEILSKKAKSRPATVRQNNRTPMQDLNTLEQLVRAETEEENLLDSYTTVPKAGSQKRVLTTPEQPQSKKVLIARSPRLLFSPASFSPSANPSQKYSSRANRGEVVASFGTAQGATWHGMGGRSASVQLLAVPEDSITKRFKYMFQKLRDVRDVLNDRIEELSQVLTDHYDIEDFRSVAMPAQEPVTFLGQIACDSNGKLNAKSVILQGDLKHSAGMQVPVDLSDLKDYSLFPGQVVALDGTNSTGRRVVASRLYEGVPLPFYQPEKQSEQEEAFEGLEQQMVLVACGPYTTSDSITYDPMMDLIDVINRDQPDICILLGPFVDSKHEQIENCQLTVTFQEVFKQCMKGIIEGTRGSGSHLVFVPSLRDVHHDFVYPQPPFHCFEPLKEDKERVHFVSDPCTLNINGVVFGVTSTDVLFHMGTEEINSYYPLYPPAEEMNIDYECFQLYAQIPVTPDVLIVPSELRYFIKDVLGCICINPGRLTKGQVGGTYGRLLLQKWNSKEAHRQTPCMATQVVKI
ncbi:DNA polymerase alpha subunit B isoform X2 [Carcharodon carcharias]|uniref:DNA polymerase alpha subunit B isoform X2 n=1 Tax=Carcharodon carcharias TaxID=13397 RepID=UPI001B7EB778|nr:DNA polymerase alpha subunit B isoform X2 [Carcharodon carcharias]